MFCGAGLCPFHGDIVAKLCIRAPNGGRMASRQAITPVAVVLVGVRVRWTMGAQAARGNSRILSEEPGQGNTSDRLRA